jgi:GTP cyclohydrolase I-like protein
VVFIVKQRIRPTKATQTCLTRDYSPDFTNTQPVVDIGPHPQWADPKKIVTFDPWGHLAYSRFKTIMEEEHCVFLPLSTFRVPANLGTQTVEVRPTIAITKAYMKVQQPLCQVKPLLNVSSLPRWKKVSEVGGCTSISESPSSLACY